MQPRASQLISDCHGLGDPASAAPRAPLVLALLVFAAGHVIAALSSDSGMVLLARVITALAAGAFWSVASVIATRAAGPANSSRDLGVMRSGVGVAAVAGVPLGSYARQHLRWRGKFLALAILAVLGAPVIAQFTAADARSQTPLGPPNWARSSRVAWPSLSSRVFYPLAAT